VIRDPGVSAIPKASRPEHVHANRAAADIVLDGAALRALDAVFPPPRKKAPLAII
jgi:diketogulonate reductase-like aldo/keto reductase